MSPTISPDSCKQSRRSSRARVTLRQLDITRRCPDKPPLNAAIRTRRMPHGELAKTIDAAFEAPDATGPNTKYAAREAVEAPPDPLALGDARGAAERGEPGM